MDADTAALFDENLEALERLNRDLFEPYGSNVGGTHPGYTAPDISLSATGIPGDVVAASAPPLTDYDRLMRVYCVMLWTCWEVFKRGRFDRDFDAFLAGKDDMIELKALRNCIVHYSGNVQRATSDANQLTPAQARILTTNGTARGYIKFDSIYLEQQHLAEFTAMIKVRNAEYRTHAGI